MSQYNKIVLPIKGMHCKSCELLIEDKLSKVKGVKKCEVNYRKGHAEIFYEGSKPRTENLTNAIGDAGYNVGEPDEVHFFSRNAADYKELFTAILYVLGAYWILKMFGITNLNLNIGSNPSSLGVVLMVGLVAGFSSCMALIGGLVLGISAKHAEMYPEATAKEKFRPHLYFNLGRILGYLALGGIIGSAGALFKFSATTLGMLTLAVGGVMLLLGLQLIGIFPRINSWKFTLPKSIGKFFGGNKHHQEYSNKNSMLVGASTFFLPCGFTQAMQLFAVSTGSFSKGAMIMGLFALGTAPGLLSVGGLSSVLKGQAGRKFFKAAGVVVIFLSLFNFNNGLNLTGWEFGVGAAAQTKAGYNDPNVKLVDGVQVVKMSETSRGYSPNKFTVKKGIPVRWEIDAKEPYSCASSLIVSKLGIQKNLSQGINTIKFTPKQVGRISFSCSMGMYTGSFNVVDGNAKAPEADSNSADSYADSGSGNNLAGNPLPSGGGCGGGSGGCGGGCGGGAKVAPDAVPTNAEVDSATDEQVIKASYTLAGDIKPNSFTVKAGQPVRFEVDVQENGSGCMSTIMVPGLYNTPVYLQAGKKIVMSFTPDAGSYQITCAMGVPRGTITAE